MCNLSSSSGGCQEGIFVWHKCFCREYCSNCREQDYANQITHHLERNSVKNCWGGGWYNCPGSTPIIPCPANNGNCSHGVYGG